MKKLPVDDLLRIACGHAISSLETEAYGHLHAFEIGGRTEEKQRSDELYSQMEQIKELYERRWGSKRK